MVTKQLTINEQSIKNELSVYRDKPYGALIEYVWNSFDAGATTVRLHFEPPENEFGYVSGLKITDNGKGWNFEKNNTEYFLSSDKGLEKDKGKSLPKGKLGRGRYVFIWFCDLLKITSDGKTLTLKTDTDLSIEDSDQQVTGTIVEFIGIKEKLSNALKDIKVLEKELLFEFCWFLKENPGFEILINGKKIDYLLNVKKEEVFTKSDFSDDVRPYLEDSFKVIAVLWQNRPTSEFSKFYFLDLDTKREITTKYTSLNKKKDDYWHSAYIYSKLFTEKDTLSESDELPLLEMNQDDLKETKKLVLEEIKKKLIHLRKPILIQRSEIMVSSLRSQKIIPPLDEFGIYDEDSYGDLLKQAYVIAPSLFVGKSKQESAFICATFAGLLSSQDNSLIKVVLEQMQELTEEEKTDLEEILKRTSLSNVVRTIKEIDSRLRVIDDLDKLLFQFQAETLEVKHLQQVLNVNPWIFGEQYRLFRDTEGALKKTLYDFAKDILGIEDPEITSQSKKELDLFLVKSLSVSEFEKRNIVVEIKRPSVNLSKKEYDQIEEYALEIKKESVCNADNMSWEFYLIGNKYNDYIEGKLDEAKAYGEKNRGLTSHQQNGRFKIYVRKWSDILHVEWEHKMKYLKDQLKIRAGASAIELANPASIVSKYQN